MIGSRDESTFPQYITRCVHVVVRCRKLSHCVTREVNTRVRAAATTPVLDSGGGRGGLVTTCDARSINSFNVR